MLDSILWYSSERKTSKMKKIKAWDNCATSHQTRQAQFSFKMATPKPFQFGIIKILNFWYLLFCTETYAKAKEASAVLQFRFLIQLPLAMLFFFYSWPFTSSVSYSTLRCTQTNECGRIILLYNNLQIFFSRFMQVKLHLSCEVTAILEAQNSI